MYFHFNSCIPGVKVSLNFLWGRYHIWKSICDWNHNLIMQRIIKCHSFWHIWLYTVEIDMVNRDTVRIKTLSQLQLFVEALIVVISLEIKVVWFCSISYTGKISRSNSSSAFYLAFILKTSLIIQKKPLKSFC